MQKRIPLRNDIARSGMLPFFYNTLFSGQAKIAAHIPFGFALDAEIPRKEYRFQLCCQRQFISQRFGHSLVEQNMVDIFRLTKRNFCNKAILPFRRNADIYKAKFRISALRAAFRIQFFSVQEVFRPFDPFDAERYFLRDIFGKKVELQPDISLVTRIQKPVHDFAERKFFPEIRTVFRQMGKIQRQIILRIRLQPEPPRNILAFTGNKGIFLCYFCIQAKEHRPVLYKTQVEIHPVFALFKLYGIVFILFDVIAADGLHFGEKNARGNFFLPAGGNDIKPILTAAATQKGSPVALYLCFRGRKHFLQRSGFLQEPIGFAPLDVLGRVDQYEPAALRRKFFQQRKYFCGNIDTARHDNRSIFLPTD